MELTTRDIDAVCKLVDELCGIYLDTSKTYLIENRLGELARQLQCDTYTDLVDKVRFDQSLKTQVVDAITTNETLFFRDNSPFEALKHKAIPESIDAKAGSVFPRRLRLWSAACSTGQEVYSIAMTLHELIPDIHSWDVSILGTDISSAAVARASRGWYAAHEIERGMTRQRLEKYFHRDGEGWRVNDELRALAKFQVRNLLEPMHFMTKFDIVFCRNVAIYFTKEVRRDLFNRISDTMGPEGYLFAGSQEILSDLGPRFTPQHHCRATYYRPNLKCLV